MNRFQWLVLMLILVACGSVPPGGALETPNVAAAPEHWGACPLGDLESFSYPLERIVTGADLVEWIELNPEAAARGLSQATILVDREGALRLPAEDGVHRWGTSQPDTVDLAAKVIAAVEEAVELGAHLLIGYPTGAPNSLGGTLLVVALLEESDEAVSLGPCGRARVTEPLTGVALDFGGASIVEFVRRVVDPTSAEATTPSCRPTLT